jgi:hypothetical protein
VKRILAGIVLSFAFALPTMGGAVYAQFDPLKPTCEAANNAEDADAICNESETGTDKLSGDRSIFVTAANALAIVAGVVAVVIIIISGITLMTSGGDSAKFTKSRNIIIYTVIGLFVVLLSRTIVVFIIDRIIG